MPIFDTYSKNNLTIAFSFFFFKLSSKLREEAEYLVPNVKVIIGMHFCFDLPPKVRLWPNLLYVGENRRTKMC